MLYDNQKTIRQIAKIKKNGRYPVGTILVAAIALLFGVPHTSHADCKTYYVSPTGKWSNTGAIDSPMVNIWSAAKKLQPCDTLYLRGGIYQQFAIYVGNSGTADAPINIRAYPNESPIFDGTGLNITEYTHFFALGGQYIKLSGLELRNGGMGVRIFGKHNTVSNMNIHHVQAHGIITSGDFSTIENNTVSQAVLQNSDESLTMRGLTRTVTWACALGAYIDRNKYGIIKNLIMRGNTVHDSWGEGIHTFQVDGALVENNIVYNTWATNYYIASSYNVLFRNNLGYYTPDNATGKISSALFLADEASLNPNSANNVIINNIFYNAEVRAFPWSMRTGEGLTNVLFANNTIVNGTLLTGNYAKASVIKNNIIFRNDGGILSKIPYKDGLTFSNNLWSMTPPPNAQGAGDVISDPKFITPIKPFSITIGGEIKRADFALSSTSPAVGKGAEVYSVTSNYLVTSPKVLDIGAYITTPPFSYNSQ